VCTDEACFEWLPGITTYNGAVLQCESKGGIMGQVLNAAENKAASSLGEGMRWIGLKDTMKQGRDRSAKTSWTWPDGSHPTWLNFNPGEPNNWGEDGPETGLEPCVAAMGGVEAPQGRQEEAPDPREALPGCLKTCPDLINMAEAAWRESYWEQETVCSNHRETKECAIGDGLEVCTEEIVKSYGEEAKMFMTSLQDFSCDGVRRLRTGPSTGLSNLRKASRGLLRRLDGNSRQLGGHMGGWFDVDCQVRIGYFCRIPKESTTASEATRATFVGIPMALVVMTIAALVAPKDF